ncbi:MAG: hypothetical protein IJD70_08310 [Clostridia bacterium]|nr:hypothetical protein [Clostridia bacterium]
MKKSVIVILLVLSLLIPTTSCSAPNTIEVASNDYMDLTKMTPGEFDKDLCSYYVLANYKWHNYSCRLSVENGKLFVSNERADMPYEQHEMFNHGYLLGTNYGEFSGWVRWCLQEELIYPEGKRPTVEETVLSDENCRFIIRLERETDCAFVVLDTVCMMDDYEADTLVYRFERIRAGSDYDYSLEFTEIASLGGDCTAYFNSIEEECVYLATDCGIYKLNYDGAVETVVEEEYFRYMVEITSIVLYEGEIYCSSPLGIYRYNPETDESLWYPMNYEKYAE